MQLIKRVDGVNINLVIWYTSMILRTCWFCSWRRRYVCNYLTRTRLRERLKTLIVDTKTSGSNFPGSIVRELVENVKMVIQKKNTLFG